jgi:hypothetical protein
VLILGVVGGAMIAASQACSLDWGVRPDPGDGTAPETSRPDVTVVDTGLDALDAGEDSPTDADPCVALGAALAAARAKAKECQFGTSGACKVTIKDECDCEFVVRAAGSTENTKYANAVAAFVAGSCPPTPACGACPQLGSMVSWICLGTGTCSP